MRNVVLTGVGARIVAWLFRPQKTYRCPCCNFKTLHSQGCMEICAVCGWEDDAEAAGNPETISYPNGITLRAAQANYREFGAVDENWKRHARKPYPAEK